MSAHRHLVPPRADRGHLKITESELRHWGEELGRSISPPLIVTQLDGQEFTAINGGPAFKFTEAISFVVNCETQEEIDETGAGNIDAGNIGDSGPPAKTTGTATVDAVPA